MNATLKIFLRKPDLVSTTEYRQYLERLRGVIEVISKTDGDFTIVVSFINMCSHDLTFDNGARIKQSGYVLNAQYKDEVINPFLVRAKTIPSQEGLDIVNQITARYPNTLLIGSIIAAQVYDGVVSTFTGMNGAKKHNRFNLNRESI